MATAAMHYSITRTSFLLCLVLSSASCFGQQPQSDTAAIDTGKRHYTAHFQAVVRQKQFAGKEPESDGSYERFMDNLISRKDVRFGKKTIEAHEDYYVDEIEGRSRRMPPAIVIDGIRFLKSDMQIVNGDEELRNVQISVDTAIVFTYHGRKYGYIDANYYNCNGSGCMKSYHFMADFRARRLYVFDMFGVPGISTPYFGDVNHDGQLDFVLPEYVTGAGSQIPYSDTTEKIKLTPYTLSGQGRFMPIRDHRKKQYYLVGKFDSGNFAPRNFTIIEKRWFKY